jgi:glycopeptide antibiotics resistance protein
VTTERWKLIARLGYASVIALATLTDVGMGSVDPADLRERLERALELSIRPRDVVDGVRNVLLFAGWGVVWSMTAPQARLARSIASATATGMLFSMTVETAQLFSARRHASILDVMTNTSGALLGAVAVVLLLLALMRARRARSYIGMPLFVFALTYACIAALEMLLPGLRQELVTDMGGHPLGRFRVAWSLLGWGDVSAGSFLMQALLMVPAGALAVGALMERGVSRFAAAGFTLVVAAPLALMLELARGFTSQPIELGYFTAHVLGIAAGAGMIALTLPAWSARHRGRTRPQHMLIAYAIVIVLWRWQPFAFQLDTAALRASFTAAHLVPLQALTMKMDVFSASVVLVGFLLHVPLGALLAVWPLCRRGWLAHVLPGIAFVVVVEVGQLFIRGRYFDVTDILIGGAGVAAGWLVMRRAGFGPHGELLPERRARLV